MRKVIVVLATLVVAVCMPLWAQVQSPAAEGERVCNQNTNFDDLETFTAQEEFSIPLSSTPLRVIAAKNGGARLVHGEGNSYQVTLCKYVGASNQSEGNSLLGQIGADHSADSLTIHGPSARDWTAFLVIRVPDGASMDVNVHNGPLSAKKVSGTFALSSVNGPISVKYVTGKVTVTAHNGPVSFTGHGGEFNLQTQNGPISVDLDGSSWESGTLDAHAQNGPISVGIPSGFQSGVVMTSSGHAPMSCQAEACEHAQRTWDEGGDHRIEIGSNPVIHVSTVNGPMEVHGRKGEM